MKAAAISLGKISSEFLFSKADDYLLKNNKIDEVLYGKYQQNKSKYQLLQNANGEYIIEVRKSELSAFADFELYKKIDKEIENSLVGTTANGGIRITGKSAHFTKQVIGSVFSRKSGADFASMFFSINNTKCVAVEKWHFAP